jgi:hypothetical protein
MIYVLLVIKTQDILLLNIKQILLELVMNAQLVVNLVETVVKIFVRIVLINTIILKQIWGQKLGYADSVTIVVHNVQVNYLMNVQVVILMLKGFPISQHVFVLHYLWMIS